MDKNNLHKNPKKSGKSYIKDFFRYGGLALSINLLPTDFVIKPQPNNFIQYEQDLSLERITQVFSRSKVPIHVVTNQTNVISALNASRALGGATDEFTTEFLTDFLEQTDRPGIAFGVQNTNTNTTTNIASCVVAGSDTDLRRIRYFAQHSEGFENNYLVVPTDIINLHIVAHESGHCLHMQHRDFEKDISTGNDVLNVQRLEMVADFIAGASIAMSTPYNERSSIRMHLQSIQDARNVSAFGSNNQEANLTHYTKDAIMSGFQAGIGRSSRHMDQVLNLARSYALTHSFNINDVDRITNELQDTHFQVNHLMQYANLEANMRLNPEGNQNLQTQIENSNQAHTRFNLALALDISPDVRQIVLNAKSAHNALITRNSREGLGLSITLRNLESNFPEDSFSRSTLRMIGNESSNRGQVWTIRALEKTISNTVNETLRENLEVLTRNIRIDNQIISDNLNISNEINTALEPRDNNNSIKTTSFDR